jgi:hypothetical protein
LPCIMHPACLQSGLIFECFLSSSSSIAVSSNALLLSDSPSCPRVWLCLFPLVYYWSITGEGTSIYVADYVAEFLSVSLWCLTSDSRDAPLCIDCLAQSTGSWCDTGGAGTGLRSSTGGAPARTYMLKLFLYSMLFFISQTLE